LTITISQSCSRIMEMKLINELTGSLNKFLCWDKRRMTCFVNMLTALMMVQTVNLKKLATAMQLQATVDSTYRRLQRFFSHFQIDYTLLAKFIVSLFKFNKGKHYLILDRTNWKWGKHNINILFLCIAYKQAAIPIFWLVLNKRGNSSTRERAVLIERFISVFGTKHIAGLLGDREFVGKNWFSYLKSRKIIFYIRIKRNNKTKDSYEGETEIARLFRHLSFHEAFLLKGKRVLYGHKLYVTGAKVQGDYLIIVTAKKPPKHNPLEAIDIYALRWKIETLFGCLKTKGFNFEDTHITHRNRIKQMIAVLTVAFCWAQLTGQWCCQNEKKITIKKHGRAQYSLFRYGLNWISEKLFKRGKKLSHLTKITIQIFEQGILRAINQWG